MDLLLYWTVAPLLFGLTFIGLGLLVRVVTRGLAAELVLPIGIATAVVIASFLTYFGATAQLAGPALAIGAIAGWALTLKSGAIARATAQRHGWWIVTTFAAFFVFGASVFLSGNPTFSGYTWIVDIAHQLDFADYVIRHGRELPPHADSSSLAQVWGALNVGYPTAIQATLAALSRPYGFELAWAYQPFLAVLAASLVPALYFVLKPLVDNRAFLAVGAFAASQASILIGYAQAGGIKELTVMLLILSAAATVPGAVGRAPSAWRAVLPLALSMAGAFSVLSLTMLPWLGLIAAGALVVGWRETSLAQVARRGAIAAGLFLLLTVPTLIAATHTGDAVSVVQNEKELGNLAAPVGKLAASGIWLTSDHRFPLTGNLDRITTVGGIIVIGLALVGLVAAVRRRSYSIIILAAAGLGALMVIVVVMGPWVELKALSLTAPLSLALAVAGLAAIGRRGSLGGTVAWIGLIALLTAGLVADAQRYRNTALAPYDRLAELQDIGERYTANATLLPDFEEMGEYLLRNAGAMSPVNPPPIRGFHLTPAAAAAKTGPLFLQDLDEFELPWLSTFDFIVTRRDPRSSRPPANFTLAEQGQYYSVWKRTATAPASTHAALSGTAAPIDRRTCREFVTANRAARSIAVAPAPTLFNAAFSQARASANFVVNPERLAMGVFGPGAARGVVTVPTAGRYDVYLMTGARRPTGLRVDDGPVHEINDNAYAMRSVLVTSLPLTAGRHRITLSRKGGSLAPGSIDPPGQSVGPVTLVKSKDLHPAIRMSTPKAAKCGELTDWVEARD